MVEINTFKNNKNLIFSIIVFLIFNANQRLCVHINNSYRSLRSSESNNNKFGLNNDYYNLVTYSEIKNFLEVFPSKKILSKYDDRQAEINEDSFVLNNQELDRLNNWKEITDFNEIFIDHEAKFIYIGAKNYLIKLSYENDTLRLINADEDLIEWKPMKENIEECKRMVNPNSDRYCHNYIRVISLDRDQNKIGYEKNNRNERLLVCGTYAQRPLCSWRGKSSPNNIMESFDGVGKIPPTPDSSLTYLKLSSGDFYFATSIDYSEQGMKADYLIERSIGPSIQLRTDQYNSNWLNDPVFVGSITIGNYVYFFIRETAIEHMNCGEKTYSRVVRLCKYDQGIENIMIWRNFEKARLNCSIPGHNSPNSNNYFTENNQYPFYFDEIQHIYFEKTKNLIYATFSTPLNGVKSSAICVYDLKSIENAFNGPFKHQKTKDSIWVPLDQPTELNKCESSTRTFNNHADSNKYQLRDLSVQPLYQKPILVLPNRRISKLVVDNVITKHQNNIEILFLATETNTILKYMLLNLESALNRDTMQTSNPVTCHLEEIEMFGSTHKSKLNIINNLALLENSDDKQTETSLADKSKRSLIIATSVNIIKMPVANCKAQTNYFSCLSLMNPYCIWDSKAQKCILIFNTNETLYSTKTDGFKSFKTISQSIRQNAHLHQHPINTCPSTNLPVDGGFSEWTSWTNCIAKSGEKCKCRMRVCNSPDPRNGGKNCDEHSSIEISNCQIDGGWTLWSSWSACKGAPNNCDGQQSSQQPSVRTRFRTCTNPEPKFNGRVCVGLDQEEDICTLEMINPCAHSNNHQWMSWGSWEECSKSCGEGFQMRRRLCNGKNCVGSNQEWRTCNTEPCKEKVESVIGEWEPIEINNESKQKLEKRVKFICKYDHYLEANNLNGMELNTSIEYRICEDEKFCRSLESIKDLGIFTPWTEWSQCKECSDKQYRTRRCSIVNNCFGHDSETRECNCNNKLESWSCWSNFSPCSVNCGKGIQKRSRICLGNPISCQGPKEEIITCHNTNCSFYDGLSNGIKNKDGFNLAHIAIFSIIAFLLGSSSVLIIIYINFKRNSSSKSQSLFCCCCKSKSNDSKTLKLNSKINQIHNHLNDKQSFDHNSLETDTAATDVQNNDSSKFCSTASDSSSNSAASNHSKEYFTIGNRFDPTGLSLLNNIIPDDDDEEMLTLGINNSNSTNSGTLGRGKNTLKLNSKHINFELPNKSFNTYTNQRDVVNKNSKNGSGTNNNSNGLSSSTNNNSNNNTNNNTINNNSNTLRYSSYMNSLQTGSIRSTAKQQRTTANAAMRTNLNQEL